MKHIKKTNRTLAVGALAVLAVLSACNNPVGSDTSDSSNPSSPTTYTVTYDQNGADSGTPPTDTSAYTSGDEVTILGNTGGLANGSDTFLGWNTEPDGSGTDYSAGATLTMGNGNLTLYARWVPAGVNIFTVTFESNGGNSVASQDVVEGETATEPPPPTRTGYTFSGWYADSGLTTVWDFDTDTVSSATTLYAAWTTGSYDVAFDANGGAGSMADQAIEFGSSANLATNTYTRSGYSFSGWNTEVNGSGTSYADGASFTMDVEGMTLYAQWSTSQVPSDIPASAEGAVDGSAYGHLEFEYYGGDNTSGYNTDVYLSPSASSFDPELYLWLNDATDSSAIDPGTYTLDLSGGTGTLEDVSILAGTDYAATVFDQDTFEDFAYSPTVYDQITSGTVTVSVSGDTYTFQWSFGTADGDTLAGSYSGAVDAGDIPDSPDNPPVTYSVNYAANNADGGTVPVDSSEYEDGDSVTVLGNTGNLTRTDYSFDGWNTASNGTGIDYAAGDSFTISNNVTLYAQWDPIPAPAIYSVIYNGNGNTSGSPPSDTDQYATGDSATVLGNTGGLQQDGSLFDGWNTSSDGTGTSYVAGDTLAIGTGDVTLYAQWRGYQLGDTGPAGGYIFYDDEADGINNLPGARFLEAAPVNQIQTAPWGAVDDYQGLHENFLDIAGSNADAAPEFTAIGTGDDNTAAIVAAYDTELTTSYAASIADELVVNGYDDWYLPSRDELDQLRLNPPSGAPSGWYFSSSEAAADFAMVYEIGSVNSFYYDEISKDFPREVWPIRSFGSDSSDPLPGSGTNGYSIGDIGPAGGTIIYDKGFTSGGWRYLEAAPRDAYARGKATMHWAPSPYVYPTDVIDVADLYGDNATVVPELTAIGDGLTNTENIVVAIDDHYVNYLDDYVLSLPGGVPAPYAAKTALQYEINGYSDWFLPSENEANLLITFESQIPGLVRSGLYWSSTESSRDDAVYADLNLNSIISEAKSDDFRVRVRAIRRF